MIASFILIIYYFNLDNGQMLLQRERARRQMLQMQCWLLNFEIVEF